MIRSSPPENARRHAHPSHDISVKCQKPDAISIRRKESHQQRNHAEGPQHPTVAAVFLLAFAHASAGRKRQGGKYNGHTGKHLEHRTGKERAPPAPAHDRQTTLNHDRHGSRNQNLRLLMAFSFHADDLFETEQGEYHPENPHLYHRIATADRACPRRAAVGLGNDARSADRALSSKCYFERTASLRFR
jgi:hypothetical protein